MIRGINHINLSVRDLDQSFNFYHHILAFKPVYRTKTNAYFEVGSLWFCINLDLHTRISPLPEYTHVAFDISASDFPLLVGRLEAARVPLWKENNSEGPSLYFLDPDHHKLEIHVGTLQSRLDAYKKNPREDMIFYPLHSS
jgi:catechol 2,3-dioxygenase-like lactoylglutathione lyase family enzyme